MPQRKPHSILGVSSDASEEEIRSAFHKAAKKYHPDKQTNQEDKEKANLKFSEINEAFESLISQFHSNYNGEGVEGEQDLNEEAPSRIRPKEGGKKVRKRSGASSTRNLSSQENSTNSPTSTRREGVKTHRRSNSFSNSPGINHSKRSIRSSGGLASPGATRSPGSMSGRKSIRDNLKSPNGARPRPPPGSSPTGHRRTRSAMAAPPSRPPLETSPTVGRKKISAASPMHSPSSPRRPTSARSFNNRTSSRNVGDASLSPHGLRKKAGHARHSSLGSLNYNHAGPPPAPPMTGGSPKLSRPTSSGNLRQSIRRGNAPPPPSAMQRLSMKITNRSERKAEKKARAEKLLA